MCVWCMCLCVSDYVCLRVCAVGVGVCAVCGRVLCMWCVWCVSDCVCACAVCDCVCLQM